MNHNNQSDQPWAILLAGGEGKRLSVLTQRITGDTTPKQFCPLIGDQSMLEQTRSRASLVVKQDRILTALTRTQERFYTPIVGDIPSRNLVIQPRNRGTAPAILYALLRLAGLDPGARVVLLPCDHFVDDDREFMRHVQLALDAIEYRPELTVLLGIAADRPETSYGWIEPGTALGSGPIFFGLPILGKARRRARRGTASPWLSLELFRDDRASVHAIGTVHDGDARFIPVL